MEAKPNIIDEFKLNFSYIKNLPIILYGVGFNTKSILNAKLGFNIVALMDPVKEGEYCYNLPVISVEEIEKYAETIIVIARDTSVKIIYKRICNYLPNNISVFDIHGNNLRDTYEKKALWDENDKYFNSSFSELEKVVARHNVISFDLFDTLISRRVIREYNLFQLVERKSGIKDFADIRVASEMDIVDPAYRCLDDIYNNIQKRTGIDDNFKRRLKELEFDIELKYTYRREDMCRLFQKAQDDGKRVFITTDTYYSKIQIEQLLNNLHVCHDKCTLLVSSELHKTKLSGDLFTEIDTNKKDKVLHIGDNTDSDIKKAKEMGFDTYYVMGTERALAGYCLQTAYSKAVTLEDQILLARVKERVLNSPFALNKYKGRLNIYNIEDMSLVSFFPYYYLMTEWIIDLSSEMKDKSVLLLASRDGYLLYRIFERLKKDKLLPEYFPDFYYFYASRQASTISTLYTSDDIVEHAKTISLTETLGYIVKNIFGISVDDEESKQVINSQADNERLQAYLRKYYVPILYNAAIQRTEYENYIIENYHINDYKDVYFFDLYTKGTTVYNISRLINRKVNLICFATYNAPNKCIPFLGEVSSLLGNYNDYNTLVKFTKYFKLFEIISASQDNTFSGIYDNKPTFRMGKVNDFEHVDRAQQIIISEIEENIRTDTIGNEHSVEFIDELLSILENDYSEVDFQLKKIFLYESIEDGQGLTSIWEQVIG